MRYLDFVIYGYVSVRRDREEGAGGGCATFVRQGIPYKVLGVGGGGGAGVCGDISVG